MKSFNQTYVKFPSYDHDKGKEFPLNNFHIYPLAIRMLFFLSKRAISFYL